MRGIVMCAKLAAAVAGRLHAHQARVQLVLQVAAQDAVLDQRGALRRRAFVVDVERAAARASVPSSTTVTASGRDALADAAAERRRALAVEVAFEPVADRLVQQDARPARRRARRSSCRPAPARPRG
jgi:hypothetical protein